jgi:hypothetical protein
MIVRTCSAPSDKGHAVMRWINASVDHSVNHALQGDDMTALTLALKTGKVRVLSNHRSSKCCLGF